MGTYTTNYNLFMPSVGEQGWGTLVNGNFTTIDTTMKGLSNRIGTLETEADAVENTINGLDSRIKTLEGEVNGALSCTSVTTSGKVTANGGIVGGTISGTTGTFSGTISGNVDLSKSLKLNNASNIVSGLYVDHTVTWLSVTNTTSSATRTYKANTINNTVILSLVCDQPNFASGYSMTLNGTTILSNIGSVTKTLKDGDVLVATGKTWSNVPLYARIRCVGWLVNP